MKNATANQLTPAIFTAFEKFINQRPGLDPRNYYSDWRDRDGRRAYQREARSIQADGKRARAALRLAQAYPFDAAALLDATNGYSGRLQIVCTDNGSAALDYTTGQYWPTEYRIAAAVVLERYCETVRPKMVSGQIPRTVAELKEMSRQSGSHFFDRDSMRFFRSRILPNLYVGPGGVYFVTSEQYSDNSPRKFTIRRYEPETATIHTFGEFNELDRAEALTIGRRASQCLTAPCCICGGTAVKNSKPCWKCHQPAA